MHAALRQLIDSPIEFSPADACYVLPGQGKKRGLTRILGALVPVPHGDVPPEKKARRSKNDPVPGALVWRHTADSRYFIKMAVPTCRDSTGGCSLEQYAEDEGRSGIGRAYNTRHGSLVDEQIKLRIAHGREILNDRSHAAFRGGLDPCTATLLDYLRARGQRPVAAQVPLYSPTMDVATAFDLMTDDGTVYEIKSTTVATPEAIVRGDRSYETPRARLTRTALRGTPCSQYSIGQLQLFITCAMITETTGFEPPAAAVLRVSPGVVRRYELNQWFKTRAERFRQAIAKKTGQHKRNKRKKRYTQKIV